MFISWSSPVPIHFTAQLHHPGLYPHQLCLLYGYLTPKLFWPKVPNPIIGGKETKNEYVQMKMMVRRVDMGVDKGNCLSLVTIMYLCRAKTDRVTID